MFYRGELHTQASTFWSPLVIEIKAVDKKCDNQKSKPDVHHFLLPSMRAVALRCRKKMCSTCVHFIQKQSHISGSKEGMLEKEVGVTWSVSWSLLNIRGLLCLFKPSFCMTCILCTFVHFMYLFYTKVSHYIHAYIICCHFLRLRRMPPRGGLGLIRKLLWKTLTIWKLSHLLSLPPPSDWHCWA